MLEAKSLIVNRLGFDHIVVVPVRVVLFACHLTSCLHTVWYVLCIS